MTELTEKQIADMEEAEVSLLFAVNRECVWTWKGEKSRSKTSPGYYADCGAGGWSKPPFCPHCGGKVTEGK